MLSDKVLTHYERELTSAPWKHHQIVDVKALRWTLPRDLFQVHECTNARRTQGTTIVHIGEIAPPDLVHGRAGKGEPQS